MSGGSRRSGGNEAREQQIVLRRIDGGDSEHIADRRIGGGAAPLAQDLLLAREGDDVVDGEEIGRVIELRDQRQLLREEIAHLLRRALRIALRQGAAHQFLQPVLRRPAVRDGLVGIFIGEFAQMKLRDATENCSISSIASGASAKSRAISCGVFKWRSALLSSRRPACASVICSRTQVSTSCKGRSSGQA